MQRKSLTFADAGLLAARGYEPVPITPGDKGPIGLSGWQQGHPPERWLPWCAGWGIGILARHTPAIDLDIRDRAIVRALVELVDATIGACPVRFGQRPKALLACSTTEPFEKITTRWFGLPGDDWTATGYKPHRVEVLGDGQQWVAFAVHPNTRLPYRWSRGSILDLDAVDLPDLDQAAAERFTREAERVLLACGAVPLRRVGSVYVVDAPTERQERRRSGNGAAVYRGGDREWQALGAAAIAKRIDCPSLSRRRRVAGAMPSSPGHQRQLARDRRCRHPRAHHGPLLRRVRLRGHPRHAGEAVPMSAAARKAAARAAVDEEIRRHREEQEQEARQKRHHSPNGSAKPEGPGGNAHEEENHKTHASEAPKMPPFLDWRDLAGRKAPPRRFIWTPWIPRQCVTLLHGYGGTGKSTLAQQIATTAVFTRDLFGSIARAFRVIGWFGEDDHDELWRRQENINA